MEQNFPSHVGATVCAFANNKEFGHEKFYLAAASRIVKGKVQPGKREVFLRSQRIKGSFFAEK
jgi:hypothetical protein